MKKGQKLKCIKSKGDYLTTGKTYKVSSGAGNIGVYGHIERTNEIAFEIIDDEGDAIFQASLMGSHGFFEVIS